MQRDQDNEQGFNSDQFRLSINSLKVALKNIQINESLPTDYQIRYIKQAKIFNKQPKQAIKPFLQCEIVMSRKNQNYKPKNEYFSSLEQKYSQNSFFKCVYRRFKKIELDLQITLGCNQKSLENYLNLECQNFNSQNYGLVKPLNQFKFQLRNQQQLIFDSKFQCGNLWAAYKNLQQNNQYDLILQNDTNTYGYAQWFYFSVKNFKKGMVYRLNIVNLVFQCNKTKKNSPFQIGMKLSIFSLKTAKNNLCGWKRAADNLQFYRSNVLRNSKKQKKYFYVLSFTIECEEEDDILYIAMNLPYSYSKMLSFLEQITELTQKQAEISIIHTIGKNIMPQITITNNSQKDKPVIFVIARQHPVQTVSSFMVQGFIRFLVKNCKQAQFLRNNFTFKIIPMVNVDGVIYGNSRCGLSGSDLNRQWYSPCKILHNSIYALKQRIRNYKVQFFLDFHGHSKHMNCFSFCCNDQSYCKKAMQFPFLLSKIEPGFVFQYCTFGINRLKQKTARAIIYRMFNINSITVECSYYGVQKLGNRAKWEISQKNLGLQEQFIHWQPAMLYRIGQNFGKCLFMFYSKDENYCLMNFGFSRTKYNNLLEEQFPEVLKKVQQDIESDSDPEEFEINIKKKIEMGILPNKKEFRGKILKYKGHKKNIKTNLAKNKNKKKVQKNNKNLLFKLFTKQQQQKKLFNKNSISIVNKQQNKLIHQNQKKIKSSIKKKQRIIKIDDQFQQKRKSPKLRRLSNIQFVLEKDQININKYDRKINFHLRQKLEKITEHRSKDYKNNSQSNQLNINNNQLIDSLKSNIIGSKIQNQLPILCIFSEKKKKKKIEQLKEKNQQSKNKQIIESANIRKLQEEERKEKINIVKERIERKRNNNFSQFSKIWLQNITRYGILNGDDKKNNKSIFY